jgi:hypothetical protein
MSEQHDQAPAVGDLVRVRTPRGRTLLLEITSVDDLAVHGLIPYQSTYTSGGQYESSYRGQASRLHADIEAIVARGVAAPSRKGAER